MIRHIVILNFKKGAHEDYLALLESTKPLILSISGVDSYSIYENESQYTPENVCSFGVELFFKNEAGLCNFMKDPAHYEANSYFEKYLADPAYMVLTHKVN